MPVTSAAAGVSAGIIGYFGANTAPAGWIKANGAVISRTTYAALFLVIGTTYGVGDGSTTFGIPDLRGEFPRGWDDARGIDSGRAIGTAQAGDVQSHTHPLQLYVAGGSVWTAGSSDGNPGSTTPTNATGGSETRPRNIALLACIKF